MFCNNCGTNIDDNSVFCLNCGARVQNVDPISSGSQLQKNDYSKEPESEGVPNQYEVPDRTSNLITGSVFCRSCGRRMGAGDKFCPSCGMSTIGNNFAGNDQIQRSEKSKTSAALISFFGGTLGLHRLYCGRKKEFIITIVIYVVGALIADFIILSFIVCSIWNLIDFFVILFGNYKDGNGIKIQQ